MIYLILSSAFIDKEDISKGYEPILKIGYTGEDSRKSRFDTYVTENPTIKVLYLIEGGTEVDESNLHNHFKHLKKDYGREWFKYDEEILNFFETHTTKKSLKELSLHFSRDKIKAAKKEVLADRKKLSQLNYIVSKIISIYFSDIRRDIYKCNVLYNRLFNELVVNFNDLTDFLSEYYPMVDYMGDIEITDDVNLRLDELYSHKHIPDKLRYLCSLDENMANSLLPHLPESLVNYYTVLGPEKIKALRYNTTDIKRAYEGIMGNQGIDIKPLIISEFEVEEIYSKAEVKKKLAKIYKDAGYTKTPRAVDLGDYFIIKNCMITNKETGKRDNCYRIVSIKSE